MEHEFPFGNSVWEILVYLSRNPVFPGNFPFGKTKLVFSIYIPTEISGFFFVNGKQPICTLRAAGE